MPWANPNCPNLADFTDFVENYCQVSPLYLPADSPFLQYSLNRAIGLVVRAPGGGPDYTITVYNGAFHILLTITPDQPGRSFFREKRDEYNLLKPSVGVVASASDEGTSETLAVPDAIRQLTIGDLQFMRSPWGREYLSWNQDFGDVFGLT